MRRPPVDFNLHREAVVVTIKKSYSGVLNMYLAVGFWINSNGLRAPDRVYLNERIQ